jgi:predicted dehydrogenase
METKKIKAIGLGSFEQHHARVYAEMPEAELAGVYDAGKRRAAKHDSRKNGTRAFGTIEALKIAMKIAGLCRAGIPT